MKIITEKLFEINSIAIERKNKRKKIELKISIEFIDDGCLFN